jgi:hypothetical protein
VNEFHPENPLIVQGDHTVLVEVDSPLYAEARDALARFAELVKSPEHIHTYRITPLSIWNACAVGDTAETIVGALRRLSTYPLPGHVGASVRDFAARYGCLKLTRRDGDSLVVSKIANFSVDLPDAAVAIQVSGMFGSRQEEAQRLGRILRPKPGENQAHFYSLVSRDTVEQDFALNRQLFLCEQGYEYRIVTLDFPGESLPEPE